MARRPHGMALAAPGGFSRAEFADLPCALCGCWTTYGWLHVLTMSVVCAACLPDPYAELPREVKLDAQPAPPRLAGEVAGAELRKQTGHPA